MIDYVTLGVLICGFCKLSEDILSRVSGPFCQLLVKTSGCRFLVGSLRKMGSSLSLEAKDGAKQARNKAKHALWRGCEETKLQEWN